MTENTNLNLQPQFSGTQTTWQATAPGRVNLIGEHTDYNAGFTLPMAIQRYTTVVAQHLAGDQVTSRFHSVALGETTYWTTDGQWYLNEPNPATADREQWEPAAAPLWSRYVAGVVNQFARLGYPLPPMALQISTDVPLGGGVSSSASLEVAVAMAVQQALGIRLEGLQLAKLCQAAEHTYAGVPCGLMDQLSSVFGRVEQLMLMDCRHETLEYIAVAPEIAVLVVNSCVKHNLADGEYRQRRQQCETACQQLGVASLRDLTVADLARAQAILSDVVFRRVRHVVTENERTVQAAALLKDRQWRAVGERMDASHRSMRDDYEITCPEVDFLVSVAQDLGPQAGAWGARMTGGGFGGCIVVLADANRATEIQRIVTARYLAETGIQAESFVTRPAAGALELAKY